MKTFTLLTLLLCIQVFPALQDQKVLFDFDGGFDVSEVITNDAQVLLTEWNGDTALSVTFGTDTMPSIAFDNIKGWDLSEYVYVAIDVRNPGPNPIQVFTCLNGKRRGNGVVILEPGETDTLTVILNREWDNLPQYIRDYFWPTFRGLPGGFSTGFSPNPDTITQITVHLLMPEQSHTIDIDNIRAQHKYMLPTEDELLDFSPFIDAFGQYNKKDWPGKTHSDGDLVTQHNQELNDIQQHPGTDQWNKWGGWKTGPKLDSTGHFHTQKYGGLWWFVDPEGRLFWSNGIDCIGSGGGTLLKSPDKDRTGYFETLPDKIVNAGGGDKGYFFYTNLKKKYEYVGDAWGDTAIEIAHKRLRSWGINTIGAWSDYLVYFTHESKTPYVVNINSTIPHHVTPEVVNSELWRVLEDSLRARFGREEKTTGRDPWCIGYFIDNEMSWATRFDSATLASVVNTYFETCSKVVKDSTPNKLYLGNRKHVYTPDYMSKQELYAAAKYCDVISINRYAFSMRDIPVLEDVDPVLDKPMVVGEFHFGALDRGLAQGGLRHVKDQDQRARAYKYYVYDALKHPNLVGVHWFQYIDQPYTCRGFSDDGENYQIGFVDVCDRPYPELIQAAREVNYGLYEYRLNSTGVIEKGKSLSVKKSLSLSLSIGCKQHYVRFNINAPKKGTFTLEVYNILGRKIWDVKRQKVKKGNHIFRWNYNAASGMYIAFLRFENSMINNKFYIVKR